MAQDFFKSSGMDVSVGEVPGPFAASAAKSCAATVSAAQGPVQPLGTPQTLWQDEKVKDKGRSRVERISTKNTHFPFSTT